MLAISKKERNILIGFLGILICVAAWFLLISPLKDKTDALKSENESLSKKAEQYSAVNARLGEYEDGIVSLKSQSEDIISHYPSRIETEDQVMYWANIDSQYPFELRFGDLEIGERAAVLLAGTDAESMENVDVTTDEEGNEFISQDDVPKVESEYKLYEAPMSMNFVSTYDGMKKMFAYILSREQKNSIFGLEISYNGETGLLEGAVGVKPYYIEGLEKEYSPTMIPAVPKGVPNLFHAGGSEIEDFIEAAISEAIEETMQNAEGDNT